MAVDIITVSLVDYKDDRSTIAYFIQAGAAAADITTYINAVVDSLDLVTGALIEGVTITTDVATFGTSLKTSPTDLVDTERGVNFGYRVLNSVYRHTLRVPALEDGIGDGETVNPLIAPQSVYNGIVGETNLTVVPCNRSGVALIDDSVISPAKITFHKAVK